MDSSVTGLTRLCDRQQATVRELLRNGYSPHDIMQAAASNSELGLSADDIPQQIVASISSMFEEVPPMASLLALQFSRLDAMLCQANSAKDWPECRRIMAEQRNVAEMLTNAMPDADA